MISIKRYKQSFILAVLLTLGCIALTGCGEGGNVTAENKPPTVDAGTDSEVYEQSNVTLTATDGDSDGSISSRLWQQTSGATFALSNADQAAISFSAPSVATQETLTFTITVTDNNGDTASDTVNIIVNSTRTLNDTGITLCSDYAYGTGSGNHNNDVDCALTMETANGSDPVPTGQDGHYGRDADSGNNDDLDGHAGFSFTKLDVVNGGDLAANATEWGCVRDNVTDLIWEVKDESSGLRDKGHLYTWYNSTGVNDGGDAGYGDTGTGTTTNEFVSGSDDCSNDARCDTEKYLSDVNALTQPLCGFTDWRLPSIGELTSLGDYSGVAPAIDSMFFPYTQDLYWSSTLQAQSGGSTWLSSYNNSGIETGDKEEAYYVRLVRRH